MKERKQLRRRIVTAVAVVVPVLGIAGGAVGIIYHSNRDFQLTAARLTKKWNVEQQEGQSKTAIGALRGRLQQLENKKIAGVPATWFASYDGAQTALQQLQNDTESSWSSTVQAHRQAAQTAMKNLEKTMGKFATADKAGWEKSLQQAQTPAAYDALAKQWTKQQQDWQSTVDKLKKVSGGFDDSQPADIDDLSDELAKLLKKAPGGEASKNAQAVQSSVSKYFQETPEKQLENHASMVKQINKAISEVKAAETPVYSEVAGSNPFGSSFTNYLKTRQSQVSVAIYDAKTHRTYTFNPNVYYDTASIVKATIMADLLHNSEVTNKPLTSQEKSLMIPMIEQSNNDAASQLWDIAGEGSGVEGFLESVGMSHTTPGHGPYWGLTSTTVTDQLALMKLYAFPNALLDSQDRAYGLNLMESVVGWEDWGVSTGAVGHATVALKNGWSPKTESDWRINSIGYIDGDGRDYVIAVLSQNNPSEQYGIATVDEASKLIWEALG